jgi:DNA-binding GntR family transcriptional regulator
MAPRAVRPDPAYQQIAAHYRQLITKGGIGPGVLLPPSRELGEEWGVANVTVSKALRLLESEGLVQVSKKGVTVTYGQKATYSPRDRLAAMRRSGVIYPTGTGKILSAVVVPAPDDVAAAMGIEAGDSVIRRERVTFEAEQPVQRSVTWMPGELADAVPALLSTEPIPGGTIGAVRQATSRDVVTDSFQQWAELADDVVRGALNLADPSAVLAGVNTWRDESGAVLEYGQSWTAPGCRVTVREQ